ncbi:MAG TPA: tRNA pseudouridine(38-40) synthase TruA [Burkholderiales bacterium]|nr:tRNA pseudouridine(38-40) synthase TruA [Burkholderiales bacterium]
MRLAAVVEYDGSAFSGWQRQSGVRSVQQCVEEALSKVADEPIAVTVAGRTDAGVHALAQVIHFDTQATRNDYSWLRGANSNLPADAVLLWTGEVSNQFHARYSATGRHYDYVVLNNPIRPVHLRQRVTWDYRSLDIERMRAAAAHLIGTHDFTSFRAVECQARSPVRELRALTIERRGELVRIRAHANAFLHHMVRNIAGVLMQIGAGERETSWAKEVLAACDRRRGGVTAPPDGLYLTQVDYPEGFRLPRFARETALW